MKFRKLTDAEKQDYKEWARKNYQVGDDVPSFWHPETRMECEKMNCEAIDKGDDNG